jgi:hypothetical protein
LKERFASTFDGVLRRGWIEVEAEVQECIKPTVRPFHNAPYYDEPQLLAGENLITFAYSVRDETYTGILSSKDEVQKGDKFPIKYNPRNPEKNNSIDSETNWVGAFSGILWGGIALVLVGYYLWERFGAK